MAFPFVFHSTFGTGNSSEWDSETDDDTVMDFPHYTELARYPWRGAVPYTGAYCARVALAGGTNPSILTEADINVAQNAVNWFHFNICFLPDFAATADDTFDILELEATGTTEVVMGGRIESDDNTVQLGIGETAPTSFGANLEKGVWYTVELRVDVDTSGGGGDGTVDIYLTRDGDRPATTVYASRVGTLSQGAVTDGKFGMQNHLATTTGTVLLDNFIHDDARVWPHPRRQTDRTLDKTDFLFVGPGTISNLELPAGAGTDGTVTVYDVDRRHYDVDGSTIVDPQQAIVARLQAGVSSEVVQINGPVTVKHGALVVLAGTNPRAVCHFSAPHDKSFELKRRWGLARPPA